MALEAQLYQESLALPHFLPLPLPMCGLQDLSLINNNHTLSGFEEADHFWFPTFLDLPQDQQQQIACSPSSFSCYCDSVNLSTPLFQSLKTQLDMQRQGVEHFLQLQNERLRCELQGQRKQQISILIKSMEFKALSLIMQKEEDLAQAVKKNLELEAYLSKAQTERDSWEILSREKEAKVINLTNILKQVKEGLVSFTGTNQGQEESCCSTSCYKSKENSQIYKMRMACKSCYFRSSCVVFLPCRHLCSCKSCEPFLVSCPVCTSVKEASMEVFMG